MSRFPLRVDYPADPGCRDLASGVEDTTCQDSPIPFFAPVFASAELSPIHLIL
jgi:hypothetical protein